MGGVAKVIWAGAMYLRKLALGRCGFLGMVPACAVLLPDAGFAVAEWRLA